MQITRGLSALAAVALVGSFASADVLIFDNSASMNNRSNRGAGTSPIAFIESVQQTTQLSSIAVLNQLNADGDIKFLIFRNGGTTPDFVSAPQSFTASSVSTWKKSDPLNYTLFAGDTYHIGAIANVGGLWDFVFPASPYTESGITSNAPNGNVENFANPTRVGDGAADIALRLYIPSPGAAAVLALGGLVAARRRRSA